MPDNPHISRRGFITGVSAAATAGLLPVTGSSQTQIPTPASHLNFDHAELPSSRNALDLSPANWIWFPAKRILPNSFFHFRRQFEIKNTVKRAVGWIVGDSRYLLFCNGQRIQFGPAPSDPRFTEADPVDLSSVLQPGTNVIGATVLYFGFGDGTWPAGKAGFIFKLELTYENEERETLITDQSWQVQVAGSWQPGKYKRWYLRSLQECFDNNKYPHGWSTADYVLDKSWRNAWITGRSGSETALNTSISDYLYDSGSPAISQLRARQVPLLKEERIGAERLAEAHFISWQVDPVEYFDLVIESAFTYAGPAEVEEHGNSWTGHLPGWNTGLVMTFVLKEQVVGWPYLTIEAPQGTIVELLVQQGHELHQDGGPALINNNLNSWTRFICREGVNEFITFDFESVRWLQLHIRGSGEISVRNPGVLRRVYPFRENPVIATDDVALQKLFSASINTILNNSQDTIVDCMGRERQQYSGDIGHVLHVLHRAFGERRLPARFINTFSQGITLDGFFMDSWPAYDRLNRIAQRQLGLTPWGPLLDHSVAFTYDGWYHYLYTGDKVALEEVFPRLVRFFRYLASLMDENNLLPVDNLGVPAVWMDTDSYKMQRHKQCAFNLYAAGMMKDALAPLCMALGEEGVAREARTLSETIVRAVRKNFWSTTDNMLICNLPWSAHEDELRTCERSISHFILSGFANDVEKALLRDELINSPSRLGRCYPPNAQWGYWALASCGDIQPVIDEFRRKWSNLQAVRENNTMPETWVQHPDTHSQYSHAAVAPLYIAYMSIAGISILEPGAKRIAIRPLPGDIGSFSLTEFTAQGRVEVQWKGKKGNRAMIIGIPPSTTGELWLDEREDINLPTFAKRNGLNGYVLKSGQSFKQKLRFT